MCRFQESWWSASLQSQDRHYKFPTSTAMSPQRFAHSQPLFMYRHTCIYKHVQKHTYIHSRISESWITIFKDLHFIWSLCVNPTHRALTVHDPPSSLQSCCCQSGLEALTQGAHRKSKVYYKRNEVRNKTWEEAYIFLFTFWIEYVGGLGKPQCVAAREIWMARVSTMWSS